MRSVFVRPSAFSLQPICLLILLPLLAAAGVIRIEPIVTPDPGGPLPAFEIELTNQGDELARAVRATVRLGDVEARGSAIRELAPGQTVRERLALARAPVLPGLYNAVIRLAYNDINDAPFSAVSLVEVDVGKDRGALAPAAPDDSTSPDTLFAVPDLVVAPFVHSGVLTLNVIPLVDTPLDLNISLLLPREITAAAPVRTLRLEPDKPAVLTFVLRNEGARPGSSYAVFAVLDCVTGGVHRSISAVGSVEVGAGAWDGPWSVVAWFGLAAIFAVAWDVAQRRRPAAGSGFRVQGSGHPDSSHPSPSPKPETRNLNPEPRTLFPPSFLFPLLASLFILWHLSPCDLLRDTITVGGDTPAHNYLASHLKAQLFGHGRVVSWAAGWWGGFPMFQYYFPLPYALMALLSLVLPFNIAFKLMAVAGAVLLPFAAFAMGRLMRFARPAPEILALLMVPFLFVDTHTMWGVNLSSTLAGMIANSLSFALMLVALGSAWRDAADGRFRLRTTALLALVMASHFFTSVMAALVLLSYPLCQPRGGRRRALTVLAGEGALAVLLMAWWLVPLVATSAYSMEFGTNWPLTLWKTFPPYTVALVVLGVVAVAAAVREGDRFHWRFVSLGGRGRTLGSLGIRFIRGRGREERIPSSPTHEPNPQSPISNLQSPILSLLPFLWLFLAALLLFLYGFSLSPVFVNVRLWPFLFFALVVLGGLGFAWLLSRGRAVNLALLALAAGLLGGVTWQEQLPGAAGGTIRAWAEWNFGGLEGKPAWPVFRDLVMPLRGTPGRLANDLTEDNNRFGSSRIFELAPHLVGKPILEGGLVNSAAGAMFAYYIQSETSRSCAGYPPMVVPSSFNLTNATRHLELFNVKHFIARWPVLQDALARSPDWQLVTRVDGWDLYELLTHAGGLVHVLETTPVVLETASWKQRALDWIYVPEALSMPVVLVPPGGAMPTNMPRITEQEFHERLKGAGGSGFRVQGSGLSPLASTPNNQRPTTNAQQRTIQTSALDVGRWALDVRSDPSRLLSSDLCPLTSGFPPPPSHLPPRTSPLTPSALPLTPVRWESVTDDRIVFVTDAVGRPHLIKVNWFPNWQVRGADAVYRVTPDFMLVIPRQPRVELYYGRTTADRFGLALTALGWGIIGAIAVWRLFRSASPKDG